MSNVFTGTCIMSLRSSLRAAVRPFPPAFPSPRVSSTRRKLHLAPPYLLDDYIPRYQLLSSVDAAKKRSLAYAHLRECNLCPRLCGVNRYEKTGVCMIGAETVKVNTIAPHFGEGMAIYSRMLACASRKDSANNRQSHAFKGITAAVACFLVVVRNPGLRMHVRHSLTSYHH